MEDGREISMVKAVKQLQLYALAKYPLFCHYEIFDMGIS